MIKIVNPCICENARAFAKIEFIDGRLRIKGVIGPMSNGDCKGSSGQCTDAFRKGKPVKLWNDEMLQRFCDIWDRWHLNDANPCCEHQRELGWLEKAKEETTLYHFRLKREVMAAQKAAEKAALTALKKGEPFYPTKEQTRLVNLEYSIVTHEKYAPEGYEPKKSLFSGDKGAMEKKQLGWLRPEEHPDGLLCRPCPVCGYKYGTGWKKEEVPQDVIEFLSGLPCAKIKPAWI